MNGPREGACSRFGARGSWMLNGSSIIFDTAKWRVPGSNCATLLEVGGRDNCASLRKWHRQCDADMEILLILYRMIQEYKVRR